MTQSIFIHKIYIEKLNILFRKNKYILRKTK